MRTIYEARSFINENLGKEALIKVLGIRNKIDYIDGKIIECYPNVFIVDSDGMKKSFTYTDVLIGNILIHIK